MISNGVIPVLRDTVMYASHLPGIKYSFLREDCTVIENIVCETQITLYAEDRPLGCKLLGLRLIKELLATASYSYFLLTEMLVLPWIAEVVRFRPYLSLDERVQLLFAKTSTYTVPNAEIMQAGKSIVRMSTEIIMAFANWIQETPYQNQSFPTLFQVEMKRLKEEGVQFPTRLNFMKEDERMEYLNCYHSKLGLKQEITTAYCASIRQRLINLLENINSRIRIIPNGQASQYKHFIQGLIYTGDKYHHVISTVIDICKDMLCRDNAARNPTTSHILEVRNRVCYFLDWMFCVTDPQIVSEIRTKIVPVLLQYAVLMPSEREYLGLKKRSMQSLQKYSKLTRMFQEAVGVDASTGMFELVYKVIEGEDSTLKFCECETLATRNLIRRDIINRAKAANWIASTREEAYFIKQFEIQLDALRAKAALSAQKQRPYYSIFPVKQPSKVVEAPSEPESSKSLGVDQSLANTYPPELKVWKKESSRSAYDLESSAIILPEIVPIKPNLGRVEEEHEYHVSLLAAADTMRKKSKQYEVYSMISLSENSVLSANIRDINRYLVIHNNMKTNFSSGSSISSGSISMVVPSKVSQPIIEPSQNKYSKQSTFSKRYIFDYVPTGSVQFEQTSFLFFEDSLYEASYQKSINYSSSRYSASEMVDSVAPIIEPQRIKPQFAFGRALTSKMPTSNTSMPAQQQALLANSQYHSRSIPLSNSANSRSRSGASSVKTLQSIYYYSRIQELSNEIRRCKDRESSYKHTLSELRQHTANSGLNK